MTKDELLPLLNFLAETEMKGGGYEPETASLAMSIIAYLMAKTEAQSSAIHDASKVMTAQGLRNALSIATETKIEIELQRAGRIRRMMEQVQEIAEEELWEENTLLRH